MAQVATDGVVYRPLTNAPRVSWYAATKRNPGPRSCSPKTNRKTALPSESLKIGCVVGARRDLDANYSTSRIVTRYRTVLTDHGGAWLRAALAKA
jgi:hypothetical protein